MLKHNPNGRFVTVCGDGEYVVYTALAWRNKSFGSALEFVWSADSNEYATREMGSKVGWGGGGGKGGRAAVGLGARVGGQQGLGLRGMCSSAKGRRAQIATRLAGCPTRGDEQVAPVSHPGYTPLIISCALHLCTAPHTHPPTCPPPQVKVFKNFTEKLTLSIDYGMEGLHGGALVGVRGTDFVVFYDWADGRLVRRIDVPGVRDVVWSDNGALVAILGESSFYILQFSR
jgi:hypothetical protein